MSQLRQATELEGMGIPPSIYTCRSITAWNCLPDHTISIFFVTHSSTSPSHPFPDSGEADPSSSQYEPVSSPAFPSMWLRQCPEGGACHPEKPIMWVAHAVAKASRKITPD